MGFNDLRDYLDALDERRMLRVVEGADWNLEIGAISQMMQETDENPALLFDKIPGYPKGFRVLTNMLNSPKKQALALGLQHNLSDLEIARQMKERRKETATIPPREVASGPIMENQDRGDKVNILKFPTAKWRTLEGGRYIGTTTLVINRDPDEGWVNMGTYRQMIHDEKTVGFFVEPHHHGMIIAKKYWARGKACPVVAVYGQQAELFLASTASSPWGKSELDVAAAMGGGGWRHTRSRPAGGRLRACRSRRTPRSPSRAKCRRPRSTPAPKAPTANGRAITARSRTRSRSFTSRRSTTATTRSSPARTRIIGTSASDRSRTLRSPSGRRSRKARSRVSKASGRTPTDCSSSSRSSRLSPAMPRWPC